MNNPKETPSCPLHLEEANKSNPRTILYVLKKLSSQDSCLVYLEFSHKKSEFPQCDFIREQPSQQPGPIEEPSSAPVLYKVSTSLSLGIWTE